MNKISGIYKIINKTNGKYYVGSSNDITGSYGSRWCEHRNALSGEYHDNDHLQKSWNKYGESNFELIIIERVPTEQLLFIEQKYLDIAKTEQDKCYNLNFRASGGGMKGHKHSEETKKRISEKLKGRVSPMKGRKMLAPTCGFRGKQHSIEWKKKSSEWNKLRWAKWRLLRNQEDSSIVSNFEN